MARDLIPPPSPAGRPAPDGTPNLIELPPEGAPAVEASSLASSGPSEFRNRFGFLIGGLAGVIVAAVAVGAIVLVTGGPADEGLAKNWSSWKPQETTITAGPAEIAAHIAPRYRGEDGKQLVNVTGGPLEVQGIKLDVRLQSENGAIHTFNGNAVMYTLAGLGENGSIKGGTPSTARHRLLRREALELALYTFRYMPDVDEVVTELPPAPPTAAQTAAAAAAAAGSSSSTSTTAQQPAKEALFYRPGDLESQLRVPLGATLPARTPSATTIPTGQARVIDSLTLSNLFDFDYQQTADLSAHLVLDRPS